MSCLSSYLPSSPDIGRSIIYQNDNLTLNQSLTRASNVYIPSLDAEIAIIKTVHGVVINAMQRT
jgi:hypothetical protein